MLDMTSQDDNGNKENNNGGESRLVELGEWRVSKGLRFMAKTSGLFTIINDGFLAFVL